MEENAQETPPQQEPSEEVTTEGETTEDTGTGEPVENQSKIEEAREISKKIDEGNKLLSENITRLEKLKADDILGGTTEGGKIAEKPKEQTDEQYAESLRDGTFKFKE